jgi:hypothetical protein
LNLARRLNARLGDRITYHALELRSEEQTEKK